MNGGPVNIAARRAHRRCRTSAANFSVELVAPPRQGAFDLMFAELEVQNALLLMSLSA
jgi:hypothetical protein